MRPPTARRCRRRTTPRRSGVLTFPAGTTTRDISVPVVGDTRHETSKSFSVILGSPANAVIQDGTATGLIVDNDPIPAVTIDDVTATEHDSGSAAASVTVRLSRASDQVVTVSYATADGTATSPADYTAASGTVTFAPGETTKTIAVSIVGDAVDEPDETFTVNLSSPGNATIVDGQAIVTIADDDPPGPNENTRMAVDRAGLYFGATNNGAITTGPQTANVRFTNGTGTWSVTARPPWVEITGGTGAGAGTFLVGVKAGTYPAGTVLSGTVTIPAPGVPNSPLDVPVRFHAYAGTLAPEGVVDTPADNAQNVVGSLAITGWAVDDVGVSRVSIWRDPLPGEPTSGPDGKVFIGNAVQVDGARPDIDAAKSLPFDYQAGWGYLLLTNMLPRQGNGTFKLFAYADDVDGHHVLLGSKTIACDNTHSLRPFGAIDTPTQGGVVSGTAYVNFGWVLTPMPNTVPVDGSTIMVYIDGVPVGHPTHNQFRSDIAALFPGLNNSGGAVGYFMIDSTTLSNGVHTISWGVTDNAGNAEGIGSRYFTVVNGATESSVTVERSSSTQSAMGQALEVRTSAAIGDSTGAPAVSLLTLPASHTPVYSRTGFDQTAPLNLVETDGTGVSIVDASPVTRFQLTLGSPVEGGGVTTVTRAM